MTEEQIATKFADYWGSKEDWYHYEADFSTEEKAYHGFKAGYDLSKEHLTYMLEVIQKIAIVGDWKSKGVAERALSNLKKKG